MTDHDQNAIRRYRVIAISHDQCVNAHGVEAIEDRAGALVYFGDHDAIASRLRAERDAALARVKELEGELSYIRGLHMSSAELVGADYVAYQDETPALIARMFKDSEQQRDALKADNERLRGLLAGVIESLGVIDQTMPAIARGMVHGAFVVTETSIRKELA